MTGCGCSCTVLSQLLGTCLLPIVFRVATLTHALLQESAVDRRSASTSTQITTVDCSDVQLTRTE